jgi:hypothetical protein
VLLKRLDVVSMSAFEHLASRPNIALFSLLSLWSVIVF